MLKPHVAKRTSVADRILDGSMPVSETGCWLWLGHLHGSGYPRLKINKKNKSAHRYSYEAFVGPIPDGLLVCHKCDVPSCVNPAHLFVGTHKDNARDMMQKGRNRSRAKRNGKLPPVES